MTAQVSRAAADHGLLPQFFARTRAGDTPVAGLMAAGLIGTAAIVATIAPTLGQQFGLLSEASTLFALLMYLGGCAAAQVIASRRDNAGAIGGVFCIFVIAWSSMPVLKATAICMALFVLCYLPLVRRKYAPGACPDQGAPRRFACHVHVLGDECLDEEVTVVVAGVHAQFERLPGGLAGVVQQLRLN